MTPRLTISTIAIILALSCGTPPKSSFDGDTEPAGDAADGTDGSLECSSDGDCDDGNACNGTETCSGGSCQPGTPPGDGTPCETDGADGECVDDLCVPLTCGDGSLDAGEECDDGNETAGDGCEDTCRTSCHEDGECDDGNVCTDDSCEEGGTGMLCASVNNDAPCDDDNECTEPDTCADGACQPGDNICGCGSDEDCAEYEDGDLCNGTLICDGGDCVVDEDTVIECPPTSTVCNVYACVPGSGLCVPERAASGTACEDDGLLCTSDVCDGIGTCTHHAMDCSDSNVCTTDTCDPSTGCVHTPVEGCCNTDPECDDSNACTVDACNTGHVCTHTPTDCGDGNACTYDRCDSTTGCYTVPVECGDDNVCTVDTCDTTTGCVHTPTTGACDDGNPCTHPDACDPSTGACTPGPSLPYWYIDADGDGHGDIGTSVCASTAPSGYVGNHDDCCDSEPDVFTGQTTYFCSSFTCTGSTTPSWDYNCSGYTGQRYSYRGYCYWNTYGYCSYVSGWVSSTIPACGVTADFVSGCTSGCDEITDRRCQTCI